MRQDILTRRHVKSRATTEIRGISIRRCEAKVCQFNSHAAICDEDVFGLQIAVIDPNGVAIFDGIQNLQKNALCKRIVTRVESPIGDVDKKVTVRTVLEDYKRAVGIVQDPVDRDHVAVSAGFMV